MRTLHLTCTLALWATFSSCALAGDFTGTWTIDLRSKAERQRNVDCGSASFSLNQTGNRIHGNHEFSTPGCGRVNEGGEDAVKGIAIGSTAILVVTSGRNGAIVLGKATRKGNVLYWETQEQIRPGEPEGDSALILDNGLLTLEKPHEK